MAKLLPSSSTLTPSRFASSADPPPPGRHMIGRRSACTAVHRTACSSAPTGIQRRSADLHVPQRRPSAALVLALHLRGLAVHSLPQKRIRFRSVHQPGRARLLACNGHDYYSPPVTVAILAGHSVPFNHSLHTWRDALGLGNRSGITAKVERVWRASRPCRVRGEEVPGSRRRCLVRSGLQGAHVRRCSLHEYGERIKRVAVADASSPPGTKGAASG